MKGKGRLTSASRIFTSQVCCCWTLSGPSWGMTETILSTTWRYFLAFIERRVTADIFHVERAVVDIGRRTPLPVHSLVGTHKHQTGLLGLLACPSVPYRSLLSFYSLYCLHTIIELFLVLSVTIYQFSVLFSNFISFLFPYLLLKRPSNSL